MKKEKIKKEESKCLQNCKNLLLTKSKHGSRTITCILNDRFLFTKMIESEENEFVPDIIECSRYESDKCKKELGSEIIEQKSPSNSKNHTGKQ